MVLSQPVFIKTCKTLHMTKAAAVLASVSVRSCQALLWVLTLHPATRARAIRTVVGIQDKHQLHEEIPPVPPAVHHGTRTTTVFCPWSLRFSPPQLLIWNGVLRATQHRHQPAYSTVLAADCLTRQPHTPDQVRRTKTVFYLHFLFRRNALRSLMEKEENTYFRQLLDIKNANSYDHMITTMLFSTPQHLDIVGTLKQTQYPVKSTSLEGEDSQHSHVLWGDTRASSRFMGKATRVENPE